MDSEPRETPPSRFTTIFPRLMRFMGICVTLVMLVSLVIYGVDVYLENQVLTLGKTTRNLKEDNQDLQIRLDQHRSYQKVAQESSRIQGLHPPEEVIDIAAKTTREPALAQAPIAPVRKEAYGY